MDEQYDVIVLGTGFIECVLSGLLSVDGKKVLHMDRNDYYGGESASLNLDQLWERFGKEGKPPEALGRARDYNVDLVSKFIMSTGKLVKILLHTDVTRYLDFKVVDGSYVVRKQKVHKVPVTEMEGLSSGLVGLLDKNRLRQFLGFCGNLDFDDPKTHKGMDLDKVTMADVFKKFSLGNDVAEFIGHAVALYTDDSFLKKPARECLEKMALYADSLNQYGKSPYIYPLYGLGELPQGFSRLASIFGGTYMLKKPIEEIVFEDGKVAGVKSEGEVARAPIVIGDPTYFKDLSKVKTSGRVARAICILSHGLKSTGAAESYQIIIPGAQVKRTHDIYIACVSYAHCVAPAGKYIVIVSTTAETDTPEKELAPGLEMLEPIDEKFVSVTDMYEPCNDMQAENLYISNSYDAASHFETACQNIMDIYKMITGKDVDLTPANKDGEGGE